VLLCGRCVAGVRVRVHPDISEDCAALEAEGKGRPPVLIIRDIHGVVASMFRAAGVDVATSDSRLIRGPPSRVKGYPPPPRG